MEPKHAVNVLFNEQEYATLVWEAAELTLEEGRRVSVANLVRRRAFPKPANPPDEPDTIEQDSAPV